MKKLTIVGSGFSAAIAKIIFEKYKPEIISLKEPFFLKNMYERRKNIETNKLFLKKSFSYGNLKYHLKKVKIHDRLILGGNTTVWGGMINSSDLSENLIKKLEEKKIFLKKLDLKRRGCISNHENIKQLCEADGNIFNSQKFFLSYQNSFLDSFSIEEDKIKLKIIKPEKNNFEIKYTHKLILAISLPQLLDLLIRSGFINKCVNLRLDEFKHKLKYSISKKFNSYDCKKIVAIKYSFIKAIDYYFGLKLFKILKFIKIPFYVDKLFIFDKKIIKLNLDINSKTVKDHSTELMGGSIHYCNLSIDQININNYLKNISKNILGVSMPFVSQKNPGPISGDIIKHILNINLEKI